MRRKKVPVIVVGAGTSGRMAAALCEDSLVLEISQPGKQRIAAMVGCNYIHQELKAFPGRMKPVTVTTGSAPYWEMPGPACGKLQPIDGPAMSRYQAKCRGWQMDPSQGDVHIHSRPGRYEFVRTGWTFDPPGDDEINIAWGTTVYEIRPKERVLVTVSDRGPMEYEYDMLIWTAPFAPLFSCCGFDPTTLDLKSTPIYYRSETKVYNGQPDGGEVPDWFLSGAIFVEYVPHETTPVYRRTVYCDAEDAAYSVSYESTRPLDGFQRFDPGKIERNEKVEAVVPVLNDHQIYPAGRFANWNPDELTHHTFDGLVRILT
jgi:hypothetical protein